MKKPKRKNLLNAALKALLAGAETSAAIKIPATFISELASLNKDTQQSLATLSQQQFNELLIQSELATINAASAAADTKTIKGDTKEIKEIVKKLVAKSDELSAGIDGDLVLKQLVSVSKEAGQSEEIIKNQQETIRELEQQLAQSQIMAQSDQQQLPQPSQEAKDLAAQIDDDASPYALALKAIAQGDNEKADSLLDETQQVLNAVQQKKDQAQAKIYMARMQNASYAGRYQDALKYCDKLKNLAGNDSLIINNVAMVYYENAKYKEAEPLMKLTLANNEVSLGKDHPYVATDLNNLAELLRETGRFEEAEPKYKRALEIWEKSLDKDHPNVATALNNLAQLYMATNRLKEAEPLMERHLVIFLQFTRRTGHPHPHLEVAINNYGGLLMQMGHSQNDINNRLKRLAPEFFDSPDN
ncbi:MAG: tetratricopeptide repeat protein [Planctomycetota bacterium]|jgi:tetratricopeptide (TPR) repeat protein